MKTKYRMFLVVRSVLFLGILLSIGPVVYGELCGHAWGAIYYTAKDSQDSSRLMYSKGLWPYDANEEDIIHNQYIDQIINSLSVNYEIVLSGGPVLGLELYII